MANTVVNNNTDSLRLLACQIAVPPMTTTAERDSHLSNSADKVSAALSEQTTDLVVLPELSSIDYARETFNELDTLAENLDGPSFQCWRRIAQTYNTTIMYGFPRREGDARYISMAAVNPQGERICHYDKLHLAQYGASMEKEYFYRGDHLMTLEINGFRLTPIICYDIRIPELSRTLAVDHNVDAILHCGAYYRDESFNTWHAFVTTRAIENQLYFLSLNRAGEHYGDSLFCRPWMDEHNGPERFPEHAEHFKFITLRKSEIDQARKQYSFLTDRLASYELPVDSDTPR